MFGMFGRSKPRGHSRRVKRQNTQATENLEDRLLLTIAFEFDYTYDTSNFFNTAEKRETLELAGEIIGSQLSDSLSAINPGGSNSWSAVFPRPDNGNSVSVSNPSIAADTLLVYVGARNLGTTVGNGGFGGFSASGSTAWQNNVNFRGETGELSDTDFGPWGGQLTFNTTTNYHFGATVEGLSTSETDFLSVATHEIAHLLGFGLAGSFDAHVSGSNFTGPNAVAEFDGSGNVPLSGSRTHIDGGITDEGREAALDPGIARGDRKLLTRLDWAVLADIGWEYDTSVNRDFGDAPNSSYPTNLSSNGARHTLGSGLELGVTADGESNGQANGSSNGDDADGFNDDDGVVFNGFLQPGSTVSIDVTSTGVGRLDAWIDFNGDGDWADNGEQIFDSRSLSRGENRLTFTVPENANEGDTFARFRLSSAGGLNFNGAAADGEVEDYAVSIVGDIAAVDDAFSSEGTLDVLANDLPNNDVKILSYTQPAEGTVTNNHDGTLEFDGGSGFSGSTSFNYTIALEQDKLAGSSTDAGDRFGNSVAIDGDYAVVGAALEDNSLGVDAGAAYLFQRTGDNEWTQLRKFTAFDGADGDRFGFSVAIDGGNIVIGARSADINGTNDGAAYVYRRNEGGQDNWGLVSQLVGSQNSTRDQFGYSVAISGDTIAVGARLDDGNGTNSGSVYIFERNNGGTNRWGEERRIKASDAQGGDQFGYSVAISGNNLLVGAIKDDDAGVDAGSAYFLNRNEGGSENWGEFNKVSPEDGVRNDWFGAAVALDGNFAVIGKPIRTTRSRPGAAYTYFRQGSAWNFEATFGAQSDSDQDSFGYAVDIEGSTAVVGARFEDSAFQNAGLVAVHSRTTGGTGTWGLDYELFGDDTAQGDFFGEAVGISGDYIVATSPFDDDDGDRSGTVSFQEIATTDTAQVTIATSSSGSGGSGGQEDDDAGSDNEDDGTSGGDGGNSNQEGDDGDEQDFALGLGERITTSSDEGASCCCDSCLGIPVAESTHNNNDNMPDQLVATDLQFRQLDSLFTVRDRLFR